MSIVMYGQNFAAGEALIMPNRLVGAHDDDLRVRAEFLAEHVQKPVVAYERLGTGERPRVRGVLDEAELLASVRQQAGELSDFLDQHSITAATTVGYSAGGSDAILLAEFAGEDGILPIHTAVSMDPMMMCERSMSRSARRSLVLGFAGIVKDKALNGPDEIEFFKGVEPGITPVQMFGVLAKTLTGRSLKEFTTYRDVTLSDIALRALRRIDECGVVQTHLYLGEKSGIANNGEIAAEFANSSTTTVEIIKDAQHDFGEWYGWFNHIVSQALNTGE